MHTFSDLAIILTWPDATIRGDEKWMMFFKKIGFVKNLNFKVGHTGIVLVEKATGNMRFYDFGRYISPRGYGRARSQDSDPRLIIGLKAHVKDGQITNLEEIVRYFETLKSAMYGEGQLYFSVAENVNFILAKHFGDSWVERGTYPYGAVARHNNNCSRFITRMLMKASKKYHYWHGINLPETFKASPISNVVNVVNNRMIYSFCPTKGLQYFHMNRWKSFWFLIKQLGDNVSQKKSNLLPNDQIIGAVDFRSKPITIPKNATYLGGVGDGAWYAVTHLGDRQFMIKRFTTHGELEYVVQGESSADIQTDAPWRVVYDSHLLFTHIEQNDIKIRISHVKQLQKEDFKFEIVKELYA
ncbi:hypothetical protein M8998_10050 [Sphingobacterium sp. lm-10]|uniref:DUF6695 family protein n=1 Tax=Sphingobacterium sp. lm-10 TaxID=2944904 RepID=UPI002020B70D|nr:DUF6695 family protein [Sphingobacterium sp. lm-10]MCL7988279.1 hypothetical protein [Sphingobacterium sp. lm-10]